MAAPMVASMVDYLADYSVVQLVAPTVVSKADYLVDPMVAL